MLLFVWGILPRSRSMTVPNLNARERRFQAPHGNHYTFRACMTLS
jgi:hypothetical protein